MLLSRPVLAALLLLACLLVTPFSARAAQSLDTCVGFIDTVPATISTQGVWCLRHDLSTAITSGHVITINTNNVTIECNHFKLGGLAAGAGTQTNGIYANNRLNATVRHCNIRGFLHGVLLEGTGGGHVVEDNRFDGNTRTGAYVQGDGSVLRRNQVTATGGSAASPGNAFGILTSDAVDVLDNTVSGVVPSATGGGNGWAYGIRTDSNPNGRINGNGVRGLVQLGGGAAYGIYNLDAGRISLRDNDVSGDGSAGSAGLLCNNNSGSARGNTISGFDFAISTCSDSGGNAVIP